MKKDSMIIALVILAVLVALALVWQSIPAAREVTVDDYATDPHGSYLARWWVGYYEVIGTDTTLIDIDTTDSYGWYEITAPTGSYLIYAFPLWDDSTDTSLSRKSYMNLETIVAVDNDTAFFRFAKADSGFIGDITGDITGAADSAGVANTAWGPAGNNFVVPDSLKGTKVVATDSLWAGAGDFGVNGVDIAGHLNVDGQTDFDEEVDIGAAGLTISGGGNIEAEIAGSQITNFDYATIKYISAADSVKANYQTGKMYSYKFVTSGEIGAGFYGILFGSADSANVANQAHTAAKFDVSDTATFNGHAQHNTTLSVGVDGTGYDVNCYGDSTGGRLFWDGSKMALRAGRVEDEQWHPDSTGMYSFAGGWQCMASGFKSFAYGCESEAKGPISTAMGWSVVDGNYSVGLGLTIIEGQYSAALGHHVVLAEQGSYGFGRFVGTDTLNSMVIGFGINSGLRLINNIPSSIMLGVGSTTPTMTIVNDTVTVDNTLIAPEIIGDLTGNATTASTCTTWTGSGTVNDSLAALTIDIAALQATKVDTNNAYVHRDAIDWTPESQLNASVLKGNASAPWYSPTDTVNVARFHVNYYGSAAGGEWEIILLNTSGDTISWTDTLTATGWQGYDDQNPSNTTITPADGFYLDINEISGTNILVRPSFRVEFYYINP